ncbi:ATP-binding domain-containing protein [Paenibacillus profundus]|uniref:ATP-binding domain-containing protein n=1 Tax=Paenibacillus profundus TaxID=1173085 RepID=A0ABS8YFL3_9BACL|nr:3'-5' exonuclease [Paenibacillus profundus]MCE5170476.1 ATP-binding domain-containing protein [Paenibacillus profundus]
MSDTFQSAYQEEELRLRDTMEEIDRQYLRLVQIPVYTGHDFTEQVMEDTRELRRQRLKRALKEPYFGRLDFEEMGQPAPSALYVGKHGVDCEVELGQADAYPLVVDWRAPIASLFYSFSGGVDSVTFKAPEGAVEGHVHLKRNLVIRGQVLQRVVDTYNRSEGEGHVTDEFLVYRLGENKDNRLRDIVSTIQAEQDRIIRAPKNMALFIQGVAGSGKTTVALHRLAFLLYQYQEQIRAEKMMIFAPNRMFLDYISDVLPELGVGNIQQRTFPEWALEVTGLEHTVQLASPMEQIELWYGSLNNRPMLDNQASGRFKGSLAFKTYMDDQLTRMEREAVPVMDFSPWDGAVLSYDTISVWYHEEYRSYELAKRKERVVARIQRWIEMELKQERSKEQHKAKKKLSTPRMKAYMKKWAAFDALALYKTLFDPKRNVTQEAQTVIPAKLCKETSAYLKKNTVRNEDLAALLYLHIRLHGIPGDYRYDHIVIDEAQDFSPLQIAVLDGFARNHSFTILGDLSQGIHAYAGIHDWSEMRDLFELEATDYFALTRSYRSTMEIIHFANVVLERGVRTDMLAIPVFRSGQKVRIVSEPPEQQPDLLAQALAQFGSSGYNTIALLTRTAEEARALHARLSLHCSDRDIHLIDGNEQQYEGGISVLPIYLSKGLEFDAVLLMDADAAHYPSDPLDAKLLYVGCTRALHELWVLHDSAQPLSPLICTDDEETVVHGL